MFKRVYNDFINLDWGRIADLMTGNVVFDGRNCLDRDLLKEKGLHVIGVGR